MARIDRLRPAVAGAVPAATGLLESYGTLRAHAERRSSPLFGLLDVARQVRDAVDRVVVVGDRPHLALVDLLLATCCHPFHDHLPRSDRGGRPRFLTLAADDDDDRVQGTLDLLASRGGDRLADAWALVVVGTVAEPRSASLANLFATIGRAGDHGGGPSPATISAHVVAGGVPSSPAHGPACRAVVLPGGGGAGAEACVTALFPAAIAGIDVVRVLEGMATMERRFGEAALGANPVVTFVATGRSLVAPGEPGWRPLRAPRHWPGLVEWAAVLGARRPAPLPDARLATAILVEACRRRPFGDAAAPQPPSAADDIDAILLPRADEHAVGQLLALLRLAALLDGLAG